MSNELNVDILVTNVLNTMSDELDDEQMIKLKNALYVNLHDVEVHKQCYDLSTTIQNSDAKKVECFAVAKKTIKRSESSIKQYISSAWNLRTFLGKNFGDITSIDIRYYIAKKQMNNKWKDKTIETQCCYLRVFFDFLCNEELIPKNPMLKIENIKCSSEPKNPFTATEMEMLRNVCYRDTRSMALLEFLDATGLRVGSVVALRWKNLDLFNRKGFVRMKGGDVNEFRFSEKSAFYLLKMLDERMTVEGRNKEEMMERPVFTCKRRNSKTKDYEGLTTDGIRYILDEIGKKCGISDIYPHKFRRTFACDALNRGMALEDLKALMHHKQYDTTLGYARLNDSRLENSYRTYCE